MNHNIIHRNAFNILIGECEAFTTNVHQALNQPDATPATIGEQSLAAAEQLDRRITETWLELYPGLDTPVDSWFNTLLDETQVWGCDYQLGLEIVDFESLLGALAAHAKTAADFIVEYFAEMCSNELIGQPTGHCVANIINTNRFMELSVVNLSALKHQLVFAGDEAFQ